MKTIIFYDAMPYSLVQVYRYFGGEYCLHLQANSLLLPGFFLGLLFDPEDGGMMFL
jgi:hypothetical protein